MKSERVARENMSFKAVSWRDVFRTILAVSAGSKVADSVNFVQSFVNFVKKLFKKRK
jgi:hypothetical protein